MYTGFFHYWIFGTLFITFFISEPFIVNCYPNNRDASQDEALADGSEREEVIKNLPKIKTKPSTFAADEGSTVTFPCEVEDLSSLTVAWSRQKAFHNAQLFIGSYKFVKDDRMYLDGNNLVIKNVQQTDSGIYTCKVPTDKEISVNHTFFVSSRPNIVKEPASGKVTLTKGGTLNLSCKPGDEAKPDIKWEKLDGKLSSNFINVETLTIANVNRQDAGLYRCFASTYFGTTAHADFEVTVNEEPEIELPEPHVFTGIGQEVKLRCKVHGNPSPTVKWVNSKGVRLNGGELNEKDKENTITLRIGDETDFGKYECAATNRFGVESKKIEVSGRPSKPLILNTDDDFLTSGDEFALKYKVTSYSPITKIIVSHRYSKDTENFSNWNFTEIESNDVNGPSYNMQYILQNMDRNTYEIQVYAENKYGRSNGSEIYSITANGPTSTSTLKMAGSSSYAIKSSSTISIITSLIFTFCLARISIFS